MKIYTRKIGRIYHKKTFRIIRLVTHYRIFVPETAPRWFKNREQRIRTGEIMRSGAYMREGLHVE